MEINDKNPKSITTALMVLFYQLFVVDVPTDIEELSDWLIYVDRRSEMDSRIGQLL